MELVAIAESGVIVSENNNTSLVEWAEIKPGHPIIQSLQCFMLGWQAGFQAARSLFETNDDKVAVLSA